LDFDIEIRTNKYDLSPYHLLLLFLQHNRGFKSFNTARRIIKGYEIMHMLKKGQIEKVEKGTVRERVKFIAEIFGVVA